MGLLDKLKSVFNQGPDNWYDRLRPNLVLTSPEGKEFKAKWLEDTMSIEKKVGLYNRPLAKGTSAHDLGSKSLEFTSLPFYFDGKDCDLKSMALVDAIKEKGKWKIDHPLRGYFELQPLKIDINTAPIRSGNVIEVLSTWMEPIDDKTGKTGRELAGIIDALSTDVNTGMLDRILNSVNDATEAYNNRTKKIATGIKNVTDYILSPLTTSVDAVNSVFMSTQNAINDITLATVFEVEQLVGQIQDLIQIPVASSRDLKNRKSAYTDLATNIFALKNEEQKDRYSKNENIMVELALASTLVAQAQVIISTPIKGVDENENNVIGILSRVDVINTIEEISDLYNSIIEFMDETQELYSSQPIYDQYYSFSEVYGNLARLISSTLDYLQIVIYDLNVETIVTLTKPTSPVEFTINNYGGLGANDYYLDLVIDSNRLIDEELIMLESGRKVVVYS